MEKEILEFLKAVEEMRSLQKSFFSAGYGTYEKANFLELSKEKEKIVDQLIEELKAGQTKLF